MSDIYIPGVKSRFNTEKLIDDLMKAERIPKERVDRHMETLQTQKTYWQDVGRRMGTLRESARFLFSFQNPFNERIAVSQDESVLTASATREAEEQAHRFEVKQLAGADRIISAPLEETYKVPSGVYSYSVGEDQISFNFRGGSLREFTEALNRRGKEKIRASLIAVEPGTKSLFIESLVTGEKNRLGFYEDAETLALETGMGERVDDSQIDVSLNDMTVKPGLKADPKLLSLEGETLTVAAGGRALIVPAADVQAVPGQLIEFETATWIKKEMDISIPQPPPGPDIPETGSASYGDLMVENDLSAVPLPPWTAPEQPRRVDDLGVLSFTFSDGTTASIPPIRDSKNFTSYQYPLSNIAGNKTIVSLELINNNTHRDVSIQNIRIFNPLAVGGFMPLNPVSLAEDAVISIDGLEIKRPSNTINDLIPGITLTPRNVSDKPVNLEIQPDREAIKDAIISLVGNYNRLMAEVNILTRNDERIVQELSYLTPEEQEDYRKRLGIFSGDSALSQFKNTLQRAATAPYPTTDTPILLSQLGIGADVRRSGATSGYDASRLRGYLEIDERALDTALEAKIPQIRQLFGYDSDGDLIVDSGLAYTIDTIARPYVETGGIISLKTSTIDSRLGQDQRRIETLDRQLASKEAALKSQYGQMEGAFNRMERMSSSLDQFSQQANNNGR